MALLKKLIMALLISITMMVAAPSAIAAEEGPETTLNDVISLNEQTIEAMKGGEEKGKVGDLLKATKQASKSVVISGPADLKKQKASAKIKKARKAYRAGDAEKAIKLASEALDLYKQAKAAHF